MARWDIKTAADYAAAHRAIQDRLDSMTKGIKGATTQAMVDVTMDCLGKAVERAPVELGDLRGSGFAEVNGSTVAMGKEDGSTGIDVLGAPGAPSGNEIVGAIGFTAPYAFTQHEHTEFNHPIGGQAKYLESVIAEHQQRWRKHLAESAKKGSRGEGV